MKKDYKKDFNKVLDDVIKNMTPEDWEKFFPFDKTPKGWVSIEESLPQWMASDMRKGYSTYKVKDKDGKEFNSNVCDHNTWYYMAKDAGITHWFNK